MTKKQIELIQDLIIYVESEAIQEIEKTNEKKLLNYIVKQLREEIHKSNQRRKK